MNPQIPFNIIKDDISYIELSELNFIEYDTALQFFGVIKPNNLLKGSKKNKGVFVYDINNYLKKNRIVKNQYFYCPFVGLCAIKSGSDLLIERLMRKSDLSHFLRYPISLFNSITEKCSPYYMFEGSSIKYYRRVDIHYTIYRMSFAIESLDRSEDVKSLLAKEEWLKKIIFSDRLMKTGGSDG